LNSLLSTICESREFTNILRGLEKERAEEVILGLSGTMKAYLIAALYRTITTRPFILVTYNPQQAEKLEQDLMTLLSPSEVMIFPTAEIWPHEEAGESMDVLSQRMAVMSALAQRTRAVVIVPAGAVGRRLMPFYVFSQFMLELVVGDELDVDLFAERLSTTGYERVDMVESHAQYAIRGDIIDVFPLDQAMPFRLELFDNELDSIRQFDLETQRSASKLRRVTIAPAKEFFITDEVRDIGIAGIESRLALQTRGLREMGFEDRAIFLEERISRSLERLREGLLFDGEEQFAQIFYPRLETILDYAAMPLVILDEPSRVRESLSGFEAEIHEAYTSFIENGVVLPDEATIFSSAQEVFARLDKEQRLEFVLLARGADLRESGNVRSFTVNSASVYHGRLELLVRDIKTWRRKGYRVVVCVSTEGRARRFTEVMVEHYIEAVYVSSVTDQVKPGNVIVTIGALESGFEFPSLRLIVLSDSELYATEKRRRKSTPSAPGKARLSVFTDLKPGDYVVHIAHGIGKYTGVTTLEAAGTRRDYLMIQYAGEDRLYVPTEQIDLLQKYVGPEDSPPKLYKLGGAEWSKVKARIKASVEDMALGLIRLYAARESMKGHPFDPDTPWQREFEEAFPYEETPDQIKAIEEVKADMERSRPMDRLICGDVGYGKTEVAIRAAFKAVMDSKQVAVLVPTTILAQQHFATFKDRFSGYPVNIAALSRFQSPSQQRGILARLKEGTVDIVIGTHRLLQPDVKFHDLGLLIIDEEQRFGVGHKETLKEMKKTVDALTLTATPIPRTLHMALAGVRDMSAIETPPEDRYPVRTYVMEYNDAVIRGAIFRELARGGQIYFVHNRIQTIDGVAATLGKSIPDAKIAVAHGQMPEDQLEDIMLRFLDREFDILVSTTIIESGLDIPNVNTLIVTDSDYLGLSQLYQLRGRVGRSNRVAYAYFMYRKDIMLTEVAEKRLAAIREFTEFGSGFKIAMRDLEIRGAGNLLGPEQHGHIAAVGFELYSRLVEEAVRELKGGVEEEEKQEPFIDLPVSAFIDDDYVTDSRQKIDLYRKINAAKTIEDLNDLEEEFEDRFGDLPEPSRNLLSIARIKTLARDMMVASIAKERDGVIIRLLPAARVSQDCIMEAVRVNRGRILANFGKSPSVRIKHAGLTDEALLNLIESTLAVAGSKAQTDGFSQSWPDTAMHRS
jgi:transcription-repair coupling factor (superfamily II helicase)